MNAADEVIFFLDQMARDENSWINPRGRTIDILTAYGKNQRGKARKKMI